MVLLLHADCLLPAAVELISLGSLGSAVAQAHKYQAKNTYNTNVHVYKYIFMYVFDDCFYVAPSPHSYSSFSFIKKKLFNFFHFCALFWLSNYSLVPSSVLNALFHCLFNLVRNATYFMDFFFFL